MPPNPQVLEVWGDFACFSRPELKVERFSYPVITPSAARGKEGESRCYSARRDLQDVGEERPHLRRANRQPDKRVQQDERSRQFQHSASQEEFSGKSSRY